MPVARSSKTKGVNPHPTSRPQKNGTKPFACVAWWCKIRFTRQADVSKHVRSVHFGERSYCTECNAVMKQDSNLTTHINKHSGHYGTECSCGMKFKDPGACTRHRQATNHPAGPTYRKRRPSAPDSDIKSVRVQHKAGVGLTNARIANPRFSPPPFDKSYGGRTGERAREKYEPKDYVLLGPRGVPVHPSTQALGILTDGDSMTEYQETAPVERLVAGQPKFQIDKVESGANFTYDVDPPQDSNGRQGITTSPYIQHSASHPVGHYQDSTYGYYTPSERVPLAATWGNYPMAINSHFPEPSQPFTGPHAQQGYPAVFYPSQVLNPDPVSVPPWDVLGEVKFGMPVPEQSQKSTHLYQPLFQPQFEPLYQPSADFGYVYQPSY